MTEHPTQPETHRTFAVITCHNEVDSVVRCLEQMERTDPEINVVLVDDGSSDGTAAVVRDRFPRTVIASGDGNLWWSGATNLGVREALARDAEFIIFLNNDCVLPDSGISPLITACAQNPKTVVSAAIGDLKDGSPVSFGGEINATGMDYIITEQPTDAMGLSTVDWLPGHAVVLPAALYREIGPCDEKRFPQYFGDADFFLRARRVGYRLTVMPSVMVLNDRSQTGLVMTRPLSRKNLWGVLTHKRSYLRVVDNVRFFWEHRDQFTLIHLVKRYENMAIAIVQLILDKTGLRNGVRQLRQRMKPQGKVG